MSKLIIGSEPDIEWEKAFAHIIVRRNHISLFADGWAVSYMGSRKVWRRGFPNVAAARRSLTCAYKRLSKIGKK